MKKEAIITKPKKIKVKCKNSFELETLFQDEQKIKIIENQKGEGLEHTLDNKEKFYELEVAGYMFSMRQSSFESHMIILK